MTTPYRHPGYDPPDPYKHWKMHERLGEYPDTFSQDDRVTKCSICDPRIAAMRYTHNEALKREEIEAPLLARIAELEDRIVELELGGII